MRIRLRDGLWLVIALLAHGLLFLIPAERPSGQEPDSQPLSIVLTHRERVELTLDPSLESQTPETVIQPVPMPRNPAPRAEADGRRKQNQPVQPARAAAHIITTARLIDSASRIEWKPTEPEIFRRLGTPPPPAAPGERTGWFREDNLFDGMMAPAETEVLDRWLAADGSRNVVVETPSGDTYCGRSTAWDPMNPLFEPVTQYRPCGGGGKRSFRMPDRYGVQRESPEVRPESLLR
jgi:hypothetical protein